MKKFLLSIFVTVLFSGLARGETLTLSTKHDQLAYSKTSLSVKSGQSVKLVFENGASKNSGLQHNWVLVKPNAAEQVAAAAIAAGAANNWFKESPEVVAHSNLLKPGESEAIEFTAPSPGEYPYICTFPGHAQTMKGILHVVP